jgi:predicted ABC-type transport system involved in lysophospholipase L1 biosynthesis ATPase subunit
VNVLDAAPLAEAEALTVAARSGDLRVEGLGFRLRPGEALVLHGPVEAGSAVLRAVLGIDPPVAGEVRLLGERAGALGRAAAASVLSRVGFVPRSGALLANLTLRENLLLPLHFHGRLGEGEAVGRASAALARFGLADAPDVRPEAVALPVRRRVALARATLLDPELLVLDDPLDDLEDDVAAEVVSAIVAWSRERPRGLLLATHQPGLAASLHARTLPLPVTRA